MMDKEQFAELGESSRRQAAGQSSSASAFSIPSSSFALREARRSDAKAIAAIYNSYVGRGEITFEMQKRPARYFAMQLAQLGPREAYLVLEDCADPAATVLGYGCIRHYSERGGYATTCETSVYLRPDMLRRGCGSAIKAALIERCRQLGYRHLVAKVVADNAASIEYNRRFGYEMVGIQRDAGWVNGRWRDVAIMQLILTDVPPPQ